MEEKIMKALKFYLLVTKLKYKIRAGWDKDLWNVNSERLESIAEHVFGTCMLAIALDSEFDFNINIDKVIKMLALHEIGEIKIGDITPYDGISEEEKKRLEHEAWIEILDGLVKENEIYKLLLEFDERKSNEANFAYLCDKMEADIQSKVYQDMGCHISLDDENNKFLKNNRIQTIKNNGAKTVFDVWYEADKGKFENEPVFQKLLKIVKDNNMNM